MINKNLFLGRMVAAGYTQKTLASKLGITKNTINAKINGRGCFDTDEVTAICDILNITDNSEKALIFLASPSHFRDGDVATDS